MPASRLRPLVPEGLAIQEFDGTSWIGVVPFRMEGVMRRPLPDLPGISAFAELNVRLYVERDGKPGVWFLSLDAASRLAVWAARRFFHLPYFNARMSIVGTDEGFRYRSVRTEPPSASLIADYRPTSDPSLATPGSLEHWLTERYCLYARSASGALLRGDVHHRQWPLQQAEATFAENSMLAPHGLSVSGSPLLHFSRRLEVAVWAPVVVAEGR